ncbi:hypothetical protein GCM10017691_50490 [Pseudonocardia petroleophila]|uniref:Uncharacterized protein n=1 Tax=Pseudonocardia petroleophila TaxID=37331 RepID=A0A7G7MPV1_9PSEU|nr:hypothetical protein [Pseudonocardia petroleophila]QNG54812.1 hypothetical protein H6H00_13565 [Pseudonocardia petroleophila]
MARGRVLRSGAAAALAVVVAVLAHGGAGGSVDLAGAGWVFAALAGPSWWLAGRERGWTVLAVAQLAGQQVAHTALTGPDPSHVGGLLPMDLMLHAHLAAAALCALWLRWGAPGPGRGPRRGADRPARRRRAARAARARPAAAHLRGARPAGPAAAPRRRAPRPAARGLTAPSRQHAPAPGHTPVLPAALP